MTPDEKAFIITKQLSSSPANGLSANHYRKKVGLELDQYSSKERLGHEIQRLLGGLSDSEAATILSTQPYLQMDPSKLVPGRRAIDHSAANIEMLKLSTKQAYQGRLANMQAPRTDRIELIPDGTIEPDEVELKFVKQEELPTYDDITNAMGGQVKPKRKPSEWNIFVSVHSKWPCVKNLSDNKPAAVSILYKIAKDQGPDKIQKYKQVKIKTFKQFKNMIAK